MSDKNLYQRISAVMSDVEYLAKDDRVGTGNNSYKAISEEKVTSSIRNSLIKNGLVICPVKQSSEEVFTEYDAYDNYKKTTVHKTRLMSRVDVVYRIVNIDKADEFIEVVSSGSGVDSQDKGVGKAMTYAYKYMLLRTFAIPTGDDPDKIHNKDLDDQQGVPKESDNSTLIKSIKSDINAILKDNKITYAQFQKFYKSSFGSEFIVNDKYCNKIIIQPLMLESLKKSIKEAAEQLNGQ